LLIFHFFLRHFIDYAMLLSPLRHAAAAFTLRRRIASLIITPPLMLIMPLRH
jgi:hypothetical protein